MPGRFFSRRSPREPHRDQAFIRPEGRLGMRTLRTVAGAVGTVGVDTYAARAHQRHVVEDAYAGPTPPQLRPGTTFEGFHGMCGLPKAPTYATTLLRHNATLTERRLTTHNFFNQWPAITARALLNYTYGHWTLPDRPVMTGHSAGGFVAANMGIIAKGDSSVRNDVRHALGLEEDISLQQMGRFAEELNARNALYAGLGWPGHGVKLKPTGRTGHRVIIDPVDAHFIRAITYDFAQAYWRRIDFPYQEALDIAVVSEEAPFHLPANPVSLTANVLAHGVMRTMGRFIDRTATYEEYAGDPGRGYDGIVPIRAAWMEGPLMIYVRSNHLDLVETSESARALGHAVHLVDNHSTEQARVLQLSGHTLYYPDGRPYFPDAA
jgi:hypothetical protein